MTDLNKAISDYIADVRKNLICSRKLKKTIINDFRNSVLDLAEERKVTDINEIYAHFGTPKEIAESYLTEADAEKFSKTVIIRRIILAVAIICAAVLVYYASVLLYSVFKDSKGYFTESITVYEIGSDYSEQYSDVIADFEEVVVE